MPDYKKKHGKRIPRSQRRAIPKQKEEPQDILMTSEPARKPPKEDHRPMRVVKGKRLENKRRFQVVAAVLAVLLITVAVFELILPAGIVEHVRNAAALVGAGGYPITLDSTDTIHAVSKNGYYYVLTNTQLSAFSNGGKTIYSFAHGFENPILKTSRTRAMCFSQGGNQAVVYHLGGLAAAVESEEPIRTGAIADSGAFALVTKNESYASVVRVYNKKGRLIYTWNSASETVNGVAISPNGKKIAVSVFSAPDGVYHSKIMILNLQSASPEFSKEINGELVYEVSASGNGFYAVTEHGIEHIAWSKYKAVSYRNDYSLALFRMGAGGAAAVFSRESDRTDNRVAIFSPGGALKSEFEYKGTMSDIQVTGGHIYCMSDTTVRLISGEGKVIRTAECGFGGVKLIPIGTNLAAIVSDNRIDKIKLEEQK